MASPSPPPSYPAVLPALYPPLKLAVAVGVRRRMTDEARATQQGGRRAMGGEVRSRHDDAWLLLFPAEGPAKAVVGQAAGRVGVVGRARPFHGCAGG